MISHQAFPSVNNDLVLLVTNAGKEMIIDCTPKQYLEGLKGYKEGKLIQEAFPFLSDEEREFLLSGMTPEDWASMPCECGKTIGTCLVCNE